jgi:hypothetical protein
MIGTVTQKCQHPRLLHRVDRWADTVLAASIFRPGVETVTTRTVCLGCDTTLRYSRVQTSVPRRTIRQHMEAS